MACSTQFAQEQLGLQRWIESPSCFAQENVDTTPRAETQYCGKTKKRVKAAIVKKILLTLQKERLKFLQGQERTELWERIGEDLDSMRKNNKKEKKGGNNGRELGHETTKRKRQKKHWGNGDEQRRSHSKVNSQRGRERLETRGRKPGGERWRV